MNQWQQCLRNGVLSAGISVTALLTVTDADDGPWGLSDMSLAAGSLSSRPP